MPSVSSREREDGWGWLVAIRWSRLAVWLSLIWVHLCPPKLYTKYIVRSVQRGLTHGSGRFLSRPPSTCRQKTDKEQDVSTNEAIIT